jgi:hypothetical protein
MQLVRLGSSAAEISAAVSDAPFPATRLNQQHMYKLGKKLIKHVIVIRAVKMGLN